MKILAIALVLWSASTVAAADPALFSMSDTQFKTYATHEIGGATKAKRYIVEKGAEYRGKCTSGDLAACQTSLSVLQTKMFDEMRIVSIIGAGRSRAGGTAPKWLQKLADDYFAAVKDQTAALEAATQASSRALGK